MKQISKAVLGFVLLLAATGSWGQAAGQESAARLFASKQQAVVQIRVIDLASNNKSSTGTGFVIDASGRLASNYHVVANAVSDPDKYRVESLRANGSSQVLQIVAVDVINDLALLSGEALAVQPLQLAPQAPTKGAAVYSLGFPLELGITVMPGTYNGLLQNSVYQRIHFSGSLNPGMSGGPALNEAGEVIGINVATAGNQVSFLVPVDKLRQLLLTSTDNPADDLMVAVGQQLQQSQQQVIGDLLSNEWRLAELGESLVPDELSTYLKCWGYSNAKDDKPVLQIVRSCQSEDDIFLSPNLYTGKIELQFFWLQAPDLDRWRFYHHYQQIMQNFVPGNKAGKDDVGNFSCEQQLVDSPQAGGTSQSVFCVRAYKDYPQLYDVLFLRGSLGSTDKALVSHFTLAGVSREMAQQFTSRFIEAVQWQP